MLLTLHRVNIIPRADDGNEHLFIFSLENAHKLSSEPKGVESEGFNYGGTDWSLVCARKDESHLGVFLKWRYSDPCSAMMVSAKISFSISVVHQHRSSDCATFSSQPVFSSSQPLLGKSKLLPLKEFLDPARGFLDGTARQAMIELRMSECSFGFEANVDVSAKNRTRKNAGGVYYDTCTFLLANHRWFLRFYTKKLNSGGLPAVYLYLHGGSQGISLDLNFVLILGDGATEMLGYEFGEGAKFDGFGKTLSEQFSNPDKLEELNVAVDITRVVVYKLVFLKLPMAQSTTSSRNLRKSPLFFNKPPLRQLSRDRLPTPTFNMSDLSQQIFQDHYGNPWKIEFLRDAPLESSNSTNLVFEKGVYHYQNNKSKLVCIQLLLMSQNLDLAQDISMSNPLLICYFSNSLDEKGYPISFPVNLQQLADEKFGYSNENSEVLIRIDLMSVQTSSFPVRSGPKFDYLINYQLEKESSRSSINGQPSGNMSKSLKDMSASRASLSILDERPPSDSSSSHLLLTPKSGSDSFNRTKSIESLLSSGHSDAGVNHSTKSPPTNSFFLEFLQSLGSHKEDAHIWTSRMAPKRADSLKDNKQTSMFDEVALVRQARCGVREELRQKEMVDILVSFLEQKFPLHVSEIILLGSLGTGTTTGTRSDVDLVVVSADLPTENHNSWVVPLLQTLRKLLEQASIFEASISSLNCTSFSTTKSSLQFTCDDFLDVDVWISHDWSNIEDSRNGNGRNHHKIEIIDRSTLLDLTEKHPNDCRFFEMCSAQMKATLFNELSPQAKEYIKVVKNWRNTINWTKLEYRPDSYLISLLVIKATQDFDESNLISVLQRISQYLKEPELWIAWDRFYDRETAKKFIFEPPTPLVQDPTNPAINVANRLKYWGQFKTEYMNWMDFLKITT